MIENVNGYAITTNPKPAPALPLPPLVAVRCPHCGNVLVRVSKGAAVEVKCLRCKTWLVTDAA